MHASQKEAKLTETTPPDRPLYVLGIDTRMASAAQALRIGRVTVSHAWVKDRLAKKVMAGSFGKESTDLDTATVDDKPSLFRSSSSRPRGRGASKTKTTATTKARTTKTRHAASAQSARRPAWLTTSGVWFNKHKFPLLVPGSGCFMVLYKARLDKSAREVQTAPPTIKTIRVRYSGESVFRTIPVALTRVENLVRSYSDEQFNKSGDRFFLLWVPVDGGGARGRTGGDGRGARGNADTMKSKKKKKKTNSGVGVVEEGVLEFENANVVDMVVVVVGCT